MPPLHRGVLNGGASEHKTKRNEKDKYQLQEQLVYLGSGFIESYKCYTLSTSIREIHPVSHVSRAMRRGIAQQHLPINYCVPFVRALAKLIVLVKNLGVIGSPIIDQLLHPLKIPIP